MILQVCIHRLNVCFVRFPCKLLEKVNRPSREMSEILGLHASSGEFQIATTKCKGVFNCLNKNCTFRQSYQVAHQAVGTTFYK